MLVKALTKSRGRNCGELDHISVFWAIPTVIVHGVAFRREELALLKERKASLVWCPTSNHFTLGRTLPG